MQKQTNKQKTKNKNPNQLKDKSHSITENF